ncbi:hypothetical protein SRABI112_05340 [Pseudomonas mediterranea]|nr:hypothetical protein SRABI112_05340 [Pseudomonas mediterranea]
MIRGTGFGGRRCPLGEAAGQGRRRRVVTLVQSLECRVLIGLCTQCKLDRPRRETLGIFGEHQDMAGRGVFEVVMNTFLLA